MWSFLHLLIFFLEDWKSGKKETEHKILKQCGCNYGILMTLEGFEKYRRCDYFDEARCVKRILQEYLFSRNPKTYEKCLPPCKGTTFIADTVTVCVQFVVGKLLYKVSTSFKRFVSIGMQMPVPMPSSKNSTIFLMIWQYFLSKLS